MRPRIGITTSFEEGEQRLHLNYVAAVEAAGGLPILIPMLSTPQAMRDVAALLDGLVITGGPAITDGLVGSLPDDINETPSVRAVSDKALLEAVLDAGKPILGICYGMQLLNAVHGGTIYADVQAQQPGTMVHSSKRGGTTHPMRIHEGTWLHRLLATSEIDVNTRHVQAVAEVAPTFRVSATAPDGVVEAIETEDGTLLGLQFHPERMADAMGPVFRHLVVRAGTTPRQTSIQEAPIAAST